MLTNHAISPADVTVCDYAVEESSTGDVPRTGHVGDSRSPRPPVQHGPTRPIRRSPAATASTLEGFFPTWRVRHRMIALSLSLVQFLVAHVAVAGLVYARTADAGRGISLLAVSTVVLVPFVSAFFIVGLTNTMMLEVVVLSAALVVSDRRGDRPRLSVAT